MNEEKHPPKGGSDAKFFRFRQHQTRIFGITIGTLQGPSSETAVRQQSSGHRPCHCHVHVSELAAGSVPEAGIPEHMRWIPKGMTVAYLKMAKTDLTAVSRIPLEAVGIPGAIPVPVQVSDENGVMVFEADIYMHLSQKKEKADI